MSVVNIPGSVSTITWRGPGESKVAATKSSGALNTWKDIAAHLGRGVRTVQRWERELRMPVHRPYGRSRTSVMALPSELDAWAAQHGMQERREAAKSKL